MRDDAKFCNCGDEMAGVVWWELGTDHASVWGILWGKKNVQ